MSSWAPSAREARPAVYDGTKAQLFLIGAAKSGTTTVARSLAAHPEILLSDPKEPYFFELFYEKGLRHYWDACFADRWSGQPVVVDGRHRNQYLPFVPGRIAASAPNPLFVSILREPVERAHSHWWHWRSRGVEPLGFGDAVREDWKRREAGIDFGGDDGPQLWARNYPEEGPNYNGLEALLWRTYVDTGFYAEQLTRYVETFGRDRLLVVFTDELRDDPAATFRRISEFVGVAPLVAVEQESRVENRAHRPHQLPTAARNPALKSVVRRVLPVGPYRWLRARLHRPVTVPTVDRATGAFLSGLYAPHNAALRELLGRPLPPGWTTGRDAA